MKADRQKRPKVRHVYSLMCETLVAGNDNRLSLINIIGNIKINGLPGGLSSLGIVVGFVAPTGELFSIAIEDPKRALVFKTDDTIVKPHDMYNKIRMAVKITQIGIVFAPIIFKVEGIHHIVLRVGGRVVHREPFGVFIDPDQLLTEGDNATGTDISDSPAKNGPDKRRRSRRSRPA